MAGDEQSINHYLYGCTAKRCCRRNGPFGCEAVGKANFGLYLTDGVSGVGTAARPIAGKTDRRTARSHRFITVMRNVFHEKLRS
ncbi:hypothetical protein PS880_03567 [Pseudomonas fluorescens]|uniref:Uncharacterized protein n=1 Tax=Pseudomonas fluorescens TaxID=294 RepID=A0A5E7LVG0_PSEFL|nr:hypothetical protein PS880_03567 [Pseudomonas fluorescens]